MRTSFIFLTILFLVSLSAGAQMKAPDALLESGLAAYRAGDLQGAVNDLYASAQAYLSNERMQAYVSSGRLEGLPSLEKALVYLALAQSRLGNEEDARETIVRLVTAERIEPAFATLQLGPEAAEIETLAARLVPSSNLPKNVHLAAIAPVPPGQTAPAAPPAPVQTAEATPAPPARSQPVAAQPVPAPQPVAPQPVAPQPVAAPQPVRTAQVAPEPETPKLPVQRTIAAEREERQRLIDELVARERERIEKDASERVAAMQRDAEQRIAAAEQRAIAAQRDAEAKLAETQRAAEQRVATAEQRATAAERDAQTKLAETQRAAEQRAATAEQRATAAERDLQAKLAETQREAEERVTAIRREAEQRVTASQREAEQRVADAQRTAQQNIAAAQAIVQRQSLVTLRQAEAFAANGELNEANAIYRRVAKAENTPREILVVAAIGLYRTGAYADAAETFRRLGVFAKGEEDLRFYNSVALFESGNYEAAKKELACALPFIDVTDDVARYRAKIEGSAARQAAAR